jgi:hypothetical protein
MFLQLTQDIAKKRRHHGRAVRIIHISELQEKSKEKTTLILKQCKKSYTVRITDVLLFFEPQTATPDITSM